MDNIFQKSYRNSGNKDVLARIIEPGLILDIGCGGGDNACELKRRGFTIDGITISQTELEAASPFLRNCYLYNLENGLPEEVLQGKYDYIICSHVLEHICYPARLLIDIKNCLKINGKLIIALPNLFHYKSRWELLKGNFNYEETGIWDNTHFKWYTFKTGAQLLVENEFIIVEKTVTGELPAASVFAKVFSKSFAVKVYNQLKRISPGLFGYQLVYVATNK